MNEYKSHKESSNTTAPSKAERGRRFACPLLVVAVAACLLCATSQSIACEQFAKELASMRQVDNALREHWREESIGDGHSVPKIVEQTMLVDRQNTARLKQLLAKCGWPKTSVYGAAAVGDAWLLAQHADQDRKSQRHVLTLMERSIKEGESPSGLLAYLSDRVAIADNQPQPYGTQLEIKDQCTVEFMKMDSPDVVNARRKSVGLAPLEEYRRQVIEHALPLACKNVLEKPAGGR